MRKLAFRFMCAGCVPFLTYCLFAFTAMNWDVTEWDSVGRFLLIMVSTALVGSFMEITRD